MAETNNLNPSDGSDTPTEGARSFGEVTERELPAGDPVEDKPDKTGEDNQGDENKGEGEPNGETKPEDKKPEITEKGTKVDPDPLSAANQLLANERRTRTQMEQVLANPEMLAQFMKNQYGIEVPIGDKGKKEDANQPQAPEFKEYKAEDLESLDDVAGVINGLQKTLIERTKSYETQIQQLNTAVSSLLQGGNDQRVATTMQEHVTALRSEPELDPNSPEFIDGLEQEISEEYHKMDFDERTGRYRGNYTLKQVGDRMISVARKAAKKGAARTQTIVKDKTEGQVRTSPKVTETEEESNNPSDSIAQGISKMFGGKR